MPQREVQVHHVQLHCLAPLLQQMCRQAAGFSTTHLALLLVASSSAGRSCSAWSIPGAPGFRDASGACWMYSSSRRISSLTARSDRPCCTTTGGTRAPGPA